MANKILSDEEIDAIPINEDGEPHGASETVKQWDRNLCQAQADFTASKKDAEIAELKVDIEELNILAKTNNDAYSAKISELEKYHQPEYETAILQQAKSESRSQAFREVGYEMMRHVRAESGLPPRWVADLIAKLQKGKEVE